jgi:CRP/FNR family cyclic AMP-dependent transcriptional regulator
VEPQASSTFWSALGPDEAAELRALGVRRTIAAGQPLWHVGQRADRVVIVVAGTVKICRPSLDGREVVLAFYGPGELVGELAALDGGERSASVFALEAVEVLAVTPDDFRAFLAAHSSVSLALVQRLGQRLRYADTKIIEFASFDALGRVAMRLTELCEHIDILLPLSQEELAGWASASLESVARALQTMRSLGWIETRRRHIRVLDPAAVRRAAS